ncbi:MAG: metal-binding protein [Thermocladium sp.]
MRCIFYVHTFDGDRCALMPPEEWRTVRTKYAQQYCANDGRGCPILARVNA